MLIDWFTVFAQIINFVILLALLRRFLYRPILDAMAAREQRIAERLAEANRVKDEAERQAAEYQRKNQELEASRERSLENAREEAEAWRKTQLQRVRDESDETRARWHRAIEHEKREFLHDLRRRASDEIYAITRQALADLADVDLEKHLVEHFTRRLGQVNEDTRQAFVGAARDSARPITVRTAFDLQPDARRLIADSIRLHFDGDDGERSVVFTRESNLLCGIEIHAAGHKVAWTFESYLDALEEQVSQAFDRLAEARAESRAEALQTT